MSKARTKKPLTVAAFVLVFFFLCFCGVTVVHAQSSGGSSFEYQPLTENFTGLFEATTVSSVLNALFTLLIAAGAILAVLRIALAGITYMLSEAFTSK